MFWKRKKREDLRGRWSDVGQVFLIILSCYMFLRWASWEPYVIPSGSMKPTLLIEDYVLVKKWAYGLRIPFTTSWLFGPQTPERGDIVVFRAKDDNTHFMVKRVVGLPGDKIKVGRDGQVFINDQKLKREEIGKEESGTQVLYQEDNGVLEYTTKQQEQAERTEFDYEVPERHIFLMGDNRDHSMDSRFWGSLPMEHILGEVSLIWMSCGESKEFSTFLCPPEAFRLDRIFKVVR